MKEIINEIIKKEQEAKKKIEQAQDYAQKIISDAEKKAAGIIEEGKLKASQIVREMIREAEKNIESEKKQIFAKENKKNETIKNSWQPLIESAAFKVFRKIVDTGHLTGKLFE
ncbi:MAG: hypothetical protein NC931_06960 [Candidatus Omnitrophica bacterium]|nr:hypothetical protein [Candidatus Omnitrophota bacterium]